MCIQSNPPRSLFRCRYWTGPKDILDGVPIEIMNASFLPGCGKFPTKNEQFSISTYDWTKLALAPSHSQQGSTMAFWDPKPILKNVSLKTPNRASSIIYPSCMQQSIRWTANDQTHHTTAKQPLSRIHHCQSFFRRRNSAAFASGPAGRLEHRRDVILQHICSCWKRQPMAARGGEFGLLPKCYYPQAEPGSHENDTLQWSAKVCHRKSIIKLHGGAVQLQWNSQVNLQVLKKLSRLRIPHDNPSSRWATLSLHCSLDQEHISLTKLCLD